MSGERTLVERLRQQAINRSTLTGGGSHEVMPEWLAADEIIGLRHLVEALKKERDAIADFAAWLRARRQRVGRPQSGWQHMTRHSSITITWQERVANLTRALGREPTTSELIDAAQVHKLLPDEELEQVKSFKRSLMACEHGFDDFEQCPKCRGWV